MFSIFPTKTCTWRNDADGDGDDDDAPTTLAPWSSPSLNAHREEISRSGHHTPHSDNKKWSKFNFYTKIDRRSFNSIGWAGFDSRSLIFPQFCLLHPLFPARPGIRTRTWSLSLIFLQFCLLKPFFPTRPSIRTPILRTDTGLAARTVAEAHCGM